MALAKIAILLWNQNDVRALISKLDYLYASEWEKIEERVIDKVSQLSLPQPLKEKVLGIIKPIGIQILKWLQYYRKYYYWREFHSRLHLELPAYLPTKLCWTPQGTLDRKRTAEVLVGDENLNVFRCYILACDYFLEDDIIQIWNRLPEDLKNYDWDNFPVISFWSDIMKRGGVGHISYKDAFYSSVSNSNKVAAKYFLQKLTPYEREECLEELAIHVDDADVLCFLLPEMEEEQQKLVFKSEPCGVLRCFLQWPFQSFFIGVANCMWDFLSRHNYQKTLGDIINKVRDGCKDYNYQNLFGEFWQKSPRDLKDSILEKIDNSSFLHSLFDIKDKEIIRIILKDATLTAKSKLIYNGNTNCYLKLSIRDNEWDFLEFFIRECLPSKNEMLKFKVKFEKSVMHSFFKEHFATKKLEWDQLFSFSDDSICEYNKLSVEEGESSSSV